MADRTVARVEELQALVDPLWDALQRVRRQSHKAASKAEVRALAGARRELQRRIGELNARIESALLEDRAIAALPAALRETANELRSAAARIRGVRSALERTADLLRLVDRALEIVV